MLVYFAKGHLPWQGVKGPDKNTLIRKLKEQITIDELTEGLPDAFNNFLKYSRRLEYDEEPNYKKCKALFDNCLTSRG